MSSIVRSTLRILGLLLAPGALLLVGFAYQPYRHILYNNMGITVMAMQQHFGRSISSGGHADINPYLDAPLRIHFIADKIRVSSSVRFDGNGTLSLRYRLSEKDPIDISPPQSWASSELAWRTFRYQIEPDGSVYLIHPSQTPPVNQFHSQPEGFPIRPNLSGGT
jgi:hypothetical protein